jgi:hypothetical protein
MPFIVRRQHWGRTFAALALGAVAAPAPAFFPPVTTITQPPSVTPPITVPPVVVPPVVVPPVDPCVKPKPMCRPQPEYYECESPTGTNSTPEPMTLVSAGVGLAIAGAVRWSRRQRTPR